MVLDVYGPRARGAGVAPAVLVVHGGGWRSGDQRKDGGAYPEAGFVAVNVNYSLATWWRPGFQGN
jgi:acetyl esterase/lipase